MILGKIEALKNEYGLSDESVAIIETENIDIHPDRFDIRLCVGKIPSNEIIALIQYVHGLTLLNAMNFYEVIVNHRQPVDIQTENV